MKRSARVARTAHDLDHVNRLRFPSFQIVSLSLKAGSKSSKCHLPSGPLSDGADDLNFIPEHETIEIHYEIDDKFGIADTGKIEFFTRFDATALWTLDLAALGADWLSPGKHIVKWDGRAVKPSAPQAATETSAGSTHDLTAIPPDKTLHADFPDGYMTIQHGPYKVRLTVSASTEPELATRPVCAWTYFHILIKGFELVLGDKELVPAVTVDDPQHKRDEAVRKQIETDGGIPAATATDPRKIVLVSNVFKIDANEMNDDTGFDQYKAMWGAGPNIPIVAKIRLAASDGSEVKIDETAKGAVALGKAKFLWDWEDPAETFTQTGKPKDFITAAIDYDKATTGPKGDNCHLDRGGKRGPAAPSVFPKQDGYAANATLTNGKFPFKVDVAATRKWASLSEPWTSGKLKGCTGAVFQPSRMAGDDYIVSVYLAYDKSAKDKLTLDADTQPLVTPDVIKKKTGKFQVWRQIDIARYVRKKSTITDFSTDFPTAALDYEIAYTVLKDATTADDKYLVSEHKNPVGASSVIDYNAICEQALLARNIWIYNQHIVSDATADHASIEAAFKLRLYEDMVKKAHRALNDADQANYTVTASSRAANVSTLVVGADHRLEPGDWIFIVNIPDNSFHGEATVATVAADSITYANPGPDEPSGGAGYVWYRSAVRDFKEVADRASWTEKKLAWALGTVPLPAPATPSFTIDGPAVVSRIENVATFEASPAHGLSVGDDITVSGVTDTTFNGTFKVKEVKSTTVITVANTGPLAVSGGGNIDIARPVTPAITNRALAAGVATITTAAAHGLAPGDKIKIEGVTPAEFNGDYEVKTKTTTTFTYDLDPFKVAETATSGTIATLSPPAPVTAAITRVALAAGVATFTTATPHGLNTGAQIRISGVTPSGFNADYTVKSKTDTTFTADCALADRAAATTAGKVTKLVKLTIAAARDPGVHKVAGVITIRTTADHGYSVGNFVVVSGVAEASINGTYQVVSVPSSKSLTVSTGGADALSSGGVVQLANDLEMKRLGVTKTWLNDWKFHTIVQYSKNMNFQVPGTELVSLLKLMEGGKTAAGKDGVTIMHFNNVHSIVEEVQSASPRPSDFGDMIYLLGEAIDVSDATRNRCAFVFYRSDVQTFVHEVGHHLFLPHAKYPTTGNNIPGGSQENRHDDDDDRCIMSYNHPTNKFCGLCQLRLRGWTALQLKKDDADNKKP